MHIEEEMGLKVLSKLGRGSFGTVYECINPRNSNTKAVKVPAALIQVFEKRNFTKDKLQRFRREAEILESIDHCNVVKFHSFRETDTSLYLLMEFVEGGTLAE